jgi:GNAT superfamily N-acetyltransferase
MPAAAVRVSFGCGNPTAVAELHEGETVLDLGAGGGLDVLLSARRVGPSGFVYGLDATAEMVELARRNATEAGLGNVAFLHGTIDHVPLANASVDVVISNCVIVLATDKAAVFSEFARVLRPGGRVGISDIIRHGDDGTAAAVDCADGAITFADYVAKLAGAGLTDVSVRPTDPLGGGLSNAIIRATRPAVSVRAMEPGDWPAVRTIYEAGIASGNATFETMTPAWSDWDRSHLADHRLVATDADGQVVGWAALSPVSDRCAYVGVAEDSVYVDAEHQRRGIGSILPRPHRAGRRRRLVDDPDRNLPRQRRQPDRPPTRRLPAGRLPRTHRPTRRRVARHHPPRTAKPSSLGRLLALRCGRADARRRRHQ